MTAIVQSKKGKKKFTLGIRNKKTQCSSRLSHVGQIPSKRQLCSRTYLRTHMANLKINFSHDHPIVSAYSLSFHPIRIETKEIFFKLFDDGQSASSARHNFEQHLLLDAATDEQKQYSLADRAIIKMFVNFSNNGEKTVMEMRMASLYLSVYNLK